MVNPNTISTNDIIYSKIPGDMYRNELHET